MPKLSITTLLLPVGLVLGAVTMQAAQAGFNVTVEAPGALNSTASFSSLGIETFDSQVTSASFTSTFGGTGITGTFNNAAISPANQYGGAGGVGNYVVDASGSFTMTVNSAITYFGLWISALNSTNNLDFYSGATLVYSFDPANLLALVGSSGPYYGNPSGQFAGQDSAEPFAFVNFYDVGGTFDKVVVSGFGYESDNYTVGTFTVQTGQSVGSVAAPEPLSLVLLGTGLVGLGLVRRRKCRQ